MDKRKAQLVVAVTILIISICVGLAFAPLIHAFASGDKDGCHQFFEVGPDTDGDGIADSATFFEWCNMVHVPLVVNNVGLPTPAPTMPVGTPMPFPTPQPTPDDLPHHDYGEPGDLEQNPISCTSVDPEIEAKCREE